MYADFYCFIENEASKDSSYVQKTISKRLWTHWCTFLPARSALLLPLDCLHRISYRVIQFFPHFSLSDSQIWRVSQIHEIQYLTSHFYHFNSKNVFVTILNSYISIWLDLAKVNCFPFLTFLTKIRKRLRLRQYISWLFDFSLVLKGSVAHQVRQQFIWKWNKCKEDF